MTSGDRDIRISKKKVMLCLCNTGKVKACEILPRDTSARTDKLKTLRLPKATSMPEHQQLWLLSAVSHGSWAAGQLAVISVSPLLVPSSGKLQPRWASQGEKWEALRVN